MVGIETAREIRKIVGSVATILIMFACDRADNEKMAPAGVDLSLRRPAFSALIPKAFESMLLRKPVGSKSDEEPDATRPGSSGRASARNGEVRRGAARRSGHSRSQSEENG